MNKVLSEKIRILSFVSIILVLYIHSGFHETANEIAGMSFNIYLQEYVSRKIARIAVPFFFIISGFLFFKNVGGIKDVLRKMNRRINTLLIPYIIAALFLPAFYWTLTYIPVANKFVNSQGVLDCFQYGIFKVLYSLYIDAGNGSPLAFHLWFLRDLIGIVLLSPILYFSLKPFKGILCLLLLFFVTYFSSVSFISSMFWFVLGAVLGSYLLSLKCKYGGLILIAFILLGAVEMLYFPEDISILIGIPAILLGVVGICCSYDIIIGNSFDLNNHNLLKNCCLFSFFIYLYHEPTLNVVRKIIVLPFHSSSLGFAISYMLSPWIFVFCAICVGILFRKFFPKVYSVLVGGR